MARLSTLPALTGLLLQVLPAGASAQVPGYRGPTARQLQAEYRAEVIGHVNEALQEWSAAWSADDVGELVDLYREDATVIEDAGAPIRGREAIREWLAGRVARDGSVQISLQDFDARGGMAVAFSTFRIAPEDASGADTGNLVTIFVEGGNRWRIRSQLFMRE